MQKNHDFFTDGILIFLDYINRQLKKDPDYAIHPLIKALINATQSFEDKEIGESVIGLSGEMANGNLHNPYSVALEKKKDGIEVLDIRELNTNKQIPLDVMICLFRLQIHLDKIPGEKILSSQSIEILNQILPEFHFYELGDKWIEARDSFAKRLENGNISIPPSFMTDVIRNAFTTISFETPWEEYPPELRSLIAGASAELFDSRSNTIIISSPPNDQIPKYKVFEFTTQILLGSEIFQERRKDCEFCKKKNVKDNILSIQDNFVIIADKYPLGKDHILVVSKKHVNAMGDLSQLEILELEEIIENVSKFLLRKSNDFVVFEPGFTGQTIYHAHMHFLPGEFFLEDVVKVYGMPYHEIEYLSEITDEYKKHGHYIFWMTRKSKNVAIPEKISSDNSFFRKIISGQLLNTKLIEWHKLSVDKEYLDQSKQLINCLRDDWNDFFERQDI